MLAPRQIRSALLALVVSACASAADNTNVSSTMPTYHSTVSEVRVTFFATDENNHALASLSKGDFAVVDNDRVIHNFRSFTHSDETALDVVVLVDTSESVAPHFRATIDDVLQLVAREQSTSDDTISVLSFGGTSPGMVIEKSHSLQPAVLCSSGCRASDSVSRIQTAKSSGTTPLYDALIFASDFISHHRRLAARPVLILFSDGNDTISLHSANDALQAALDAGALVYSVDMRGSQKSSAQHSIENSGTAFLEQISEQTGGRYLSPFTTLHDGAAAVLNAVLDDLHASYVVTYNLPDHHPGFHSVRLLPTNNLNLTFHNPEGYLYEPASETNQCE